MTPPDAFNLSAYCLEENLRRHPEKTALLFVGADAVARFTFAESARTVEELATRLWERGVKPGDRVLLRLPNAPAYAFGFLAAAAVGAIAVPLAPSLPPSEVQQMARDCDASFAFTTAERWTHDRLPSTVTPLLLELPLVPPPTTWTRPASLPLYTTRANDPAYLVYTSGTTGQPKGVLHAHRSVWGRRPMRDDWTDFQPTDRVLHAGKLNWTYTMGVGLLDPWTAGATAILTDGLSDPAQWPELIQTHQVTVFAAVPSLYRQILKYGTALRRQLASLRHGLTAGEALHPALLQRWRDEAGCDLYEALGMSECSTYISSGPHTPIQPGSPGRPQSGRRVAILPLDSGSDPLPPGEVGLLAVHRSDPGLMLGYWQRPDEERDVVRGAWFVGGDLAHLDAQGYVWFHGRNNDLMNALGYRVSPLEVERVLTAHPQIREAGVAEVAVREDVSVIGAWIVPAPGASLTLAELRRWLDSQIASYKHPREFRWVTALPRTPSGKLRRQDLSTWPYTAEDAAPSNPNPSTSFPIKENAAQEPPVAQPKPPVAQPKPLVPQPKPTHSSTGEAHDTRDL